MDSNRLKQVTIENPSTLLHKLYKEVVKEIQ